MAAGALDQRVTFRRLTRTSDGGGGVTEAWADLATVWAAVAFKSAREGLDEGRVSAAQTTVFEVYNRSDITELDRIRWDGVDYNIRAIRRYGPRRLMMWIDAERGVA